MLRCVGVVRAVQHGAKTCISLKSHNHIKLANDVRNFSHLNRTTAAATVFTNKPFEFQSNAIRFASTESEFSTLESIPEPPAIPELVSKLTEGLAAGAEPAITTLGLGGWTPAGIVQQCMEFLHIGMDLPWWGSIMIGTIVVRSIIFPLVIISQRNAAKMNNHLPQMQCLQMKLTDARQSGNAVEAARYSQELVTYMRENQVNPLKNMAVPLAQAPLFISFFIGLRQMANAPVESMRDGGLFWFVDLTVPDQFFLLPIITSFTMLATIEVGTDGAKMSAANMQTMKYVLRALPFLILPFTVNFPGAILTYWTCSNFISLAQVGFLKIPSVREYFKIEKSIVHSPDSLPQKPKGFREGLTDSWTNMKIAREIEERKRIDDIIFQKAARGGVQKTYKFDPTKPRPATAFDAKKR